MRVGLLCGTGTHNIGDDLMVDALARELSSRLVCDVACLTYGVLQDYPERNIRSLWREPEAALRACDVVLVGPGGLFPGMAFPETWAPEETHIRPAWFPEGRTFGVGLGYTPGCVVPEGGPERTQAWCERLAWVWARDPVLNDLLGHKCITCPDVAYLAAPEFLANRVPEDQRAGTLVVVNAGAPYAYHNLLAECLLRVDEGEQVTLVSATAAHGENDRRMCERIADAIDSPLVIADSNVYSWREFLHLVAKAKHVVSCRAHPCIFADMLGVPYTTFDLFGEYAGIAAVSGATGEARSEIAILVAHGQALLGLQELVAHIKECVA